MAYGTSLAEAAGRIPVFLDKIRNGANPAEMPIEVIKHSQLVINLQVAKALGITIPAAIRARADRVIN
jgi:putative ABC transport system substrate-binding protein